VAASADHIELRIVALSNPGLQAFLLRTSIQGTEGGQNVELVVGTVSPFPPDQPGTFALPISDRAKLLLDAADGQVDILVELLPSDAAKPLEPPLEVEVSAASPGRP
jgi:hypothetical protein